MASLKSNTFSLREQLYERQGKSRFSSANWKNPINALGSTIGGAFSDLSQSFVEKTSGLTNGDINKVWRAKILLDRLGGPASGRMPGLPRDGASTRKEDIPSGNPAIKKVTHMRWYDFGHTKPIRRPDVDRDGEIYESLPILVPNKRTFEVARSVDDRVIIHDKASGHKRNEIIIFNINGTDGNYQYITLQNRPPELEFLGETSWATIKSFGRNVPMYHFTGAEDKIQLQISWFCNDKDRPWEVVQKCRLLEAWSKANGYSAGPPVLQIDWGGSGLFENSYFILTSATYKLSNFKDGHIDRRELIPEWHDGKLYPMAATQELIFSRVSSNNVDYQHIYDPNKLSGLKGVGTSTKPIKDSSSLWQA